MADVPHKSKIISRGLFAALVVFLCFFARPLGQPAGCNELAIGTNSFSDGTVDIPLADPACFNYKTRAEILDMRRQAVARMPQLLKKPYVPDEQVFGEIIDGKPWWGMAGAAVFGSGSRSMLGMSEESRFVLNPFLLVAANPNTNGVWNAALFRREDINDPKFPYYWQPESLRWHPRRQMGEVVYNVSQFNQQISSKPAFAGDVAGMNRFSLVAYNARDMGLKYIFLDVGKSVNIQNDNNPTEPVHIKQYIHSGGTCGLPGGCNNMSPYMREIDRCRFLELPARAVVNLWKERPASPDQTPDMTFVLTFK